MSNTIPLPESLTSDQEKALSAEAKTGPFQHATPSYGNDMQSGETPRLSGNRHAGSTPPAAPAPAAPVPDGCVMVPREPTPEMLAVVRNGPMHETWTEGYCAMIAASPAAPVVPAVPLSCNKVPPGNGYCDHCARGEYEKCRYTTPAAPVVPLTDEQIDAIRANCWSHPGLGASFNYDKFARAIERAHGITGARK